MGNPIGMTVYMTDQAPVNPEGTCWRRRILLICWHWQGNETVSVNEGEWIKSGNWRQRPPQCVQINYVGVSFKTMLLPVYFTGASKIHHPVLFLAKPAENRLSAGCAQGPIKLLR
jgi:hypothetical protein